jgi:HlyD family secretion protein
MKRKWWFVVAVSVLATGTAAGWAHFKGNRVAAYQTVRVSTGDVDASVAATGNLNAVVTVQVGSQVSGYIKALYADFNTKVTKGQLVAVIEPEMFQAKVNQAQANLDSARDAVLNTQAAAQKAQADIASALAARENAKAQLAKVQADLRAAQLQLGRRLKECAAGLTTNEDCDNAQATYDADVATVEAAKAQVNAAEENIKSAQAQHDVVMAQVEASAAQVRQCEAALAEAKIDLEHTRITAPVDGTVIARHMDVGQTVAASFTAPTIFEIAQDLTKMQVDTNVDEADIAGIRVGQNASFTVDAFPGRTFPAFVGQIRRAPINVSNVITYDVVLTVDNGDMRLFPGMTANVRILTDSTRNVLKIPNAALRFKMAGASDSGATKKQANGQTVYRLAANGTPEAVRITTGLTDGNFTAVASGPLNEGDLIIVGGAGGSAAARAMPRGPTF